jgi:hypothetical protein
MHVRQDCQCSFVRPNVDRIAEILDDGVMPLVDLNKISEVEGGKIIEVVSFDEDEFPFTAVSHVWSGGLGSVAEEGLPSYAVEFLAGFIGPNTTSKLKLIWMDSLCIPQKKRLRKLSITGMNKVYSRALATLIMDPELMHTSPASGRQLLLWVSTSAWNQRMWTLSEGHLLRSPCFVV